MSPRVKLLPPEKRKRLHPPQEVRDERNAKRRERSALIVKVEAARKAGRPLAYLGEPHDNMMRDLRMAGLTKAQMVVAFRMNDEETLNTWFSNYPSFYDAWLEGGDEADALVARKMFQRATGYKHKAVKIFCQGGAVTEVEYEEEYPPDVQAAIFWLTNRRTGNWKTRNSTELTGADGEALVPPTITILPVAAKPVEQG